MAAANQIKVLVVDDSAFMRKMLTDIFKVQPDMVVVGTASNGRDAITETMRLEPDVVTMDIMMPEVDGIEALVEIMRKRPTPVIMVTGVGKEEAEIMMRCFEAGAIEFITKPSGTVSLDIHKIKDELLEKVRNAARMEVKPLSPPTDEGRSGAVQAPTVAQVGVAATSVSPSDAQTTGEGKVCYDVETPKEPGIWVDDKVCELATNKLPSIELKLIAIGSSTGGPQVLSRIVPRLPAHLNYAIIIVQHMPPTFTVSFADRLAKRSRLVIKEAQHGDIIKRGHVYVAPGDLHVQIAERNVGGKKVPIIEMNAEPKLHGVRPSVDVLMRSVAKVFGKNSIGVILTGMGKDGAVGMKEIAEVGGRTIVQDRSTATVYGMPGAVLELIKVDKVAPVDEIAMQILEFL